MQIRSLFIVYSILALIVNPISANAFEGNNQLKEKAKSQNLYQKKEWLNLLHFDGGSSDVDDSNFFFANDGYKNPEAELYQTIDKLFSNVEVNGEPNQYICKFPARFIYINKSLNAGYNPSIINNCKDYKTFKDNLGVKSIYLVFAAESTTHPVSSMGHLLIKTEGEYNGFYRANAITYIGTANFNNQAETIKFLFKAAISSVYGQYSIRPYSEAFQEYTELEDRNMWEYKLKTTQEQNELFVNHLWELKTINSPYKVVLYNCTAGAVSMLNLLYPDLDFNNSSTIFNPQTPMDSFNDVLLNYNIVESTIFLPSVSYRILSVYDNYSDDGINMAKTALAQNSLASIEHLEPQDKADMIPLLKPMFHKDKLISQQLRDMERTLPKTSVEMSPPISISQHHRSSRISLSSGVVDGYGDYSIGFYPVYNDLLGDNRAYRSENQMELGNTQISYSNKYKKFYLDNFAVVNIINLNPYNDITGGVSWNVDIGVKTNLGGDIPYFYSEAGIGRNYKFYDVNYYTLIGAGYSANNNQPYLAFKKGALFYEFGVGKTHIEFTAYAYNHKYDAPYNTSYSITINQSIFITQNTIATLKLSKGFNRANTNPYSVKIGVEQYY